MIVLIVAHDQNRGIGLNNQIPWFVPGELKWVAETTTRTTKTNSTNALVMGRRTWESIPETRRPLKNRLNVVISRSMIPNPYTEDSQPEPFVYSNLPEALDRLKEQPNIENIFIFGGGMIYREALDNDWIDQILVTEIPGIYEADTQFPPIPEHFHATTTEPIPTS